MLLLAREMLKRDNFALKRFFKEFQLHADITRCCIDLLWR